MLLMSLRLRIEELEGTLEATRTQRTEAQDNRDMLLEEVARAVTVLHVSLTVSDRALTVLDVALTVLYVALTV